MFGFFKKKQFGDSNMMSDSRAVAMAHEVAIAQPVMPAGIEPMIDPMDEPTQLPRGLQVKWHIGERIPWKGIWFVVVKVDVAKIELIPERMTFKMAKKIEESKAARR